MLREEPKQQLSVSAFTTSSQAGDRPTCNVFRSREGSGTGLPQRVNTMARGEMEKI